MTQKLKTYNTEAEVPTELKGFYAQNTAGKWEPQFEGVESVSGLVAKRDELLGKVSGHAGELSAKDTEITRLKGELASANVLPRGKRAVDAADAELADAAKAAGVTTADAFKALKTEHGTLTEKVTRQERRERLDKARKDYGWNDDAVDVLELVPDLPEMEDREATVNGEKKTLPHAKVKKGDEVVFKPLHEYLNETRPAVLRSVTAKAEDAGTELPDHGAGGGGGAKDPVDSYLATTYSAPKPRQAAA